MSAKYSGEFKEAIKLAHAVLDKPNLDPDGDISLLARQFLRSIEREDTGRKLIIALAAIAKDQESAL